MNPPVCQRDFDDPDLRAHGCGIASLTFLAGEMTDGHAWRDPETYAARLRVLSKVPIADFRKRGTTIEEAKVAYEAAPGFEGRQAPKLRLMRGAKVREALLPALTGGRLAIVAVRYGVIQDAGLGIGTFREGHAVVIGAAVGSSVPVADPLRRKVATWPIPVLVKAMETFGKRPWGDGRGEAAIAAPALTILEVRTKERDRARRDLATAQARIAELEAMGQPDCTDAIAKERERVKALISGGIDALIAGVGAAG